MVTRKTERKAPAVTIRFSSKRAIEAIRRAAKVKGQSLNTFVSRSAEGMAEITLDEIANRISSPEKEPATL